VITVNRIRLFSIICVFALVILGSGCSRRSEAAPALTVQGATQSTPGFINRVWRVSSSLTVPPGTLYVFLSDGTLVTTSPNSKAQLSLWSSKAGELTIVEDSIPYKTDIVKLAQSEFQIKIHRGTEVAEIAMMLAEEPNVGAPQTTTDKLLGKKAD